MSKENDERQKSNTGRRVAIPPDKEREIVKEIQEILQDRGYGPGETTGVLDDSTREALAAYQEEHGIEATGQLTAATLESLEVDVSVEEETPEVEFEREQFRTLIAKNPNYFGTQPQFDAEPVEVIEANTAYEELMCVGYEPDTERLEAVVHVKRSYGYGGDICSSGSPEYVRFYKENRDDPNKDWDDLGLRHFTAYDIPGEEDLEYGVSLQIDPEEWVCEEENLPEVRAILSWNRAPPADQPNYTPVWGNSLETTIQIDPITEFTIPDLSDQYDFQLPDYVLSGLDTTEVLSYDPPALEGATLVEKYANTSVQPHRYGFSQLSNTIENPVTDDLLDPQFELDPFPGVDVDFDPSDIIDGILETSANTYYEELDCVGLTGQRLNAVLRLKRSNGYSGGLCTGGSNEYVAFWAWDAGASRWHHLGTSAVNVHDVQNMPSGGLGYATALPVSLSDYRQPCEEGASLLRIRATLSWEQPPPPNDPDWTPTWGNSMETYVHVPPGPTPKEGESEMYLDTVGSMAPCDIDQSSGLADGPDSSTLGGFTADKSPFGGTVVVTGTVINPPQYLSGGGQLQYRVRVRPMNDAGTAPEGPWRPVKQTFDVRVLEKTGSGLPVSYWKTQKPDADGFYDYLVDRAPEPWLDVRSDVLTEWHTGNEEGMWELQLQVKEPDGTVRPADAWACAAGGTRSTVLVRLDNTRPTAEMEIDEVQPQGGSSWLDANDCGKIDLDADPDHESFPSVGDTIKGSYRASDENIHHLSLTVAPGRHVPSGAISVDGTGRNSKQFPASATHDSGDWTLDTTGMKSCGYVARFRVEDRTIVNSRHIGWGAGVTHGFCLDDSAETDGGVTARPPQRGESEAGTGPIAEHPIEVGETQFDSPGNDHENLDEEYVTLANAGEDDLNLSGYRIEDDVGHTYEFPDGFTLEAGASVTLRTGPGEDTATELYWNAGRAVWNNTGDSLSVYDPDGTLVVRESF